MENDVCVNLCDIYASSDCAKHFPEFDLCLLFFNREIEENNAMIFFLKHGKPCPKVISYDNVETEEQFQNMMAMALIIGNKDGTFTDKAFGYWNGVWYHSLPSVNIKCPFCEHEEPDIVLMARHLSGSHYESMYNYKVEEEIPNEIPDKCLACDGVDFKIIDKELLLLQCLDCGNKQYANKKLENKEVVSDER